MTTHSRPVPICWAEINTRALEDNYRHLRSLAPANADCMAVVKADAYGHSLPLCAPAALRAGAEWLAVTSVPEALVTRRLCPTARVLAIGGVLPGHGATVVQNRITPVLWTAQHIDELENAAHEAGLSAASIAVHLEIDTGMSRQGASLEALPSILTRFTPDSPLFLEAVMTHLYASDESDGLKSAEQLHKLAEALRILTAARPPHLQYLSAGASAALLGNDATLIAALAREFHLQPILRIGLALYGVAPRITPTLASVPHPALKPVLTWKTRIADLRTIPTGTEIGYNGTFTATEPMKLALLPAGYADGLDRRLGNHFSLLVRGQRAPLTGRISMDHAVLDVTEIPGVEIGDEVVILGTQTGPNGEETISAQDHADAAGTIPWEIFTSIAPRVERIAVQAVPSE
jgi:alanine racemase